jgi:hypothetical protein
MYRQVFLTKLIAWRKPARWLGRRWTWRYLMLGRVGWEVVSKAGWGHTVTVLNVEGVRVPLFNLSYVGDLYQMIKRKVVGGGDGESKASADGTSKLFLRFPAILAHCTLTRYEDGTPREPGWITLRTEGQMWRCDVKDPDTASRLTVRQTTLDDLLSAVNVLLGDAETKWEPDQWLKQNKPKGKRK